MDSIVVWGESGSSSLVTRDDLARYSLEVTWAEDRWKETLVTLPSGRGVLLPHFVLENFKLPRPFHPEYALAIELLIANAVSEAKSRGFRVASIELGVWSYRTITLLGKRVTKTGLPEPILLEDGRTKSRVGYIWVDGDNEGVMLRPWFNADQLIRLVDDKGGYYVPVDDDFGNAEAWKANSWDKVHRYPPLLYGSISYDWEDVPLLDRGDKMVVKEPCDACHHFFEGHWLTYDKKQRKSICPQCAEQLEVARLQATAQGWDFDTAKPLKVPELIAAVPCEHQWGVQAEGPAGHMVRHHVCILCGTPDPAYQND